MSEEIYEVFGAIAAGFVGWIIVEMWLGGGLLSALSPSNFPSAAGRTASTTGTPGTPGGSESAQGSGSTTGGIASANI